MMMYVWLALTVVFVITEAASAQLTSVWFALGAFVAFLATLCGVEQLWIQIVIFIAVSAIALVLTRPLVKKMLSRKQEATNADRCIGQTGIVTRAIRNLQGEGAVKVNGVEWTARTEDDREVPEGETVRILRIEGVKLIVSAE